VEVGGAVQVGLSEFLEYELFHLLGAYGVVEKRHRKLARRLEKLSSSRAEGPLDRRDAPHPRQLADLARWTSRYNRGLGYHRHGRPRGRTSMKPYTGEPDGWPFRVPTPRKLPLTRVSRFDVAERPNALAARRDPWREDGVWERIPRFYAEAVAALDGDRGQARGRNPSASREDRALQLGLATSLVVHRDGREPVRREDSSADPEGSAERSRRRAGRYAQRRDSAHAILAPRRHGGEAEASEGESRDFAHDPDFLARLCTDNLSTDRRTSGGERDPLPVYVMSVLTEAHLSMHAAEAWKSMCLGEHAERHTDETRAWLKLELDRCVALNTFVYSISRTAPWLFASDPHERANVFGDVQAAWENLVPARCMWIAVQVGLLALHRRAYARGLNGDSELAYNDYHKLQRLIRDAERRVRSAAIHVDGALEFLAALDGQAHHHIGELYRAQHAHRPARTHFNRATDRFDRLGAEGGIAKMMPHARRCVELQVSHGKASYEMGRHKEALCWHLRGWRAFLGLLAADTGTATNTDAIQRAIVWLERVRNDPEVRKSDIVEQLAPVVEQLARVSISRRYGALAGEILLRLGHLLFVLNLGGELEGRDGAGGEDRARHTLAYECLRKAMEWDPYSVQISADVLKGGFRLRDAYPVKAPIDPEIDPQSLRSVGEQWTRGGNDFEQLARSAEYATLRRLRALDRTKSEAGDGPDAPVAKGLLRSFFMNTDSINVRKSQVYEMLMKSWRPRRLPSTGDAPAIEFICMRRYSSPFPLLPRPSAFRALGGGYLIRLHSGGDGAGKPFGIAVDPGAHFVENLFRTGYSLGDIDLIVVTHDHVDHVGSLDILLSLLHTRAQTRKHEQGEHQNGQAEAGEKPPLAVTVLLSESVFTRYERARRLKRASEVRFRLIAERDTGGAAYHVQDVPDLPEPFELITMSSRHVDRKGHLDLSEKPSYGLCVRAKRHPSTSIALTSDTPSPPAKDDPRYHTWQAAWEPAFQAGVLVAHLSSVPLTELRQLAEPVADRVRRAPGEGIAQEGPRRAAGEDLQALVADEEELESIRADLEDADPDRAGMIEWGLWLRSYDDEALAPMVGHVPPTWKSPSDHAFLTGILRWARAYADAQRQERPGEPGLFVVGELSEELGTMRAKVAASINRWVFKRPKPAIGPADAPSAYALSGDVGLSTLIAGGRPRVRVLCTTCNLDADRVAEEQYHIASDVLETCVKGENEGIFYNCREHAPAQQDDPVFLEQLERFDIFGR
jgi:hypothetical protein